MITALYKTTKLYTDQSYELASLVETVKEFADVSREDAFVSGVGDAPLFGVGIKIGVTNFHGDTRC